MTATTTTIVDSLRGGTVITRARRLGRGVASVLATIGARWTDFVDGGQLGPSGDAVMSRHTGSRI